MFSSRLWQLFLDSFPKILLPGLTATIPLTIISFSLALVIAVVAALVQFANIQGLKQIARFYIWIFRGTPLLVQLFVVFFGLSRVGIVLDPFPAAVIVFSLNEGAYCAETIRAALEAVPKGQLEAGLCAGLSYLQTIFRIVLPTAIPGILSGVILAIGRIVGETAALMYTSGTVERIAGLTKSGSTLALHMYIQASEGLYTEQAYATSVVLLALVLLINLGSSRIAKMMMKGRE